MLKKHYLQLSLNYNEVSKSLSNIGEEIQILQRLIEKQDTLRVKLNHQIQLYEKDLADNTLNSYRKVAISISRKLKLMKEIDEAIDQGVIVNKKFNKTINFIKNKAHEIYKEVNDKELLMEFQVSNISKYQEHVTSLKHSLVKLEIEISDVYKEVLENNEYSNKLVSNFMDEYRMNLISDLTSQKTMNGTFTFLKNFKAIIMSTTRSLRSDLRKLKKELFELEEQERDLIYQLQK